MKDVLGDLLWGSLPVICLIATIGVLSPIAQALLPDDLWVWAIIGIVVLAFYLAHKVEKRIER